MFPSRKNIEKYHPEWLPAAAPQQPATVITPQRALATGVTAEQLRAVANWNERKSYDERRRKARARHKAQAVALRAAADELEEAHAAQVRWAA